MNLSCVNCKSLHLPRFFYRNISAGEYFSGSPGKPPEWDFCSKVCLGFCIQASPCSPYHYFAEQPLELDVDVSSLRFLHHPLFSKEHVLVVRLCSLYEVYASLAARTDDTRYKQAVGLGL